MRHSSQYVDGRFENRSPYRSELARVRKIRDYFGDQVRQSGL
ncbi:MAG: hypothetical protein ABI343_21220 [Burkholderiaceae bacterium]